MPTFILMTQLSAEVMSDPRGRKVVGKEWLKEVAAECAGQGARFDVTRLLVGRGGSRKRRDPRAWFLRLDFPDDPLDFPESRARQLVAVKWCQAGQQLV